MAIDPIPDSVRKFWDKWNIRGFIILSFSLQVILVVLAPLRKRTSNGFVIFLVWSAYLLADWAAAFALGLITNNQLSESSVRADSTGDLHALWAPFLLVHLGGPDTITAFAMEDNELWLRHLIALVYLFLPALYVFGQTLPGNKLFAPTILMLLTGIIRYMERSMCLYFASLDKFKESLMRESNPGPDYARHMSSYGSNEEAEVPVKIELTDRVPQKDILMVRAFVDVEGVLHEANAVKYAYRFFDMFKGLIVDLPFSSLERNRSREFFQGRTVDDAYKVILIELNFMYEALYTKFVLSHTAIGSIIRFIALSLTLTALVIFTRLSKGGFHGLDVRITYILLIGAVVLDFITVFMVFFTEWNLANIKNSARRYRGVGRYADRFITPILSSFLARKAPQKSKISLGNDIEYDALHTPMLYRRWAESVPAYNFIGYCVKEKPRKIHRPMGCFGFMAHITSTVIFFPFLVAKKLLLYIKLICVKLGRSCCFQFNFTCPFFINFTWGKILSPLDVFNLIKMYEEMTYVSKNVFLWQLWELIFRELKNKSQRADDLDTAKMIYEAKGNWVLEDSMLEIDHTKVSLLQFVNGVEYDESILLWHIATDLCFYTEDQNNLKTKNDYREFSKLLSDYMLYLLLMQPKLMSAVAGIGQIRFMDTQAEAERFFRGRGLKSVKPGDMKMKEACRMILEVNTDVKPVTVKGNRSKSVMFDASILAKELNKLAMQEKDKWEVMCKVWIELLCYGAGHCRADAHAQTLSKGGELLTLVWLLMFQYGIGEQFHASESGTMENF